ncbi:hypothetical protein [Priestia megaterium]
MLMEEAFKMGLSVSQIKNFIERE